MVNSAKQQMQTAVALAASAASSPEAQQDARQAADTAARAVARASWFSFAALIVGAIAERMKYAAVMAFILIWMFVVYFPLAHMVWGVDGMMNGVWNANASISLRRRPKNASRAWL